jgi:hypothetical protein
VSVGAWDFGPFENDDAVDFAARLAGAPRWSTVQAVLGNALLADYLEAPEASEAIAAAAFVAAAHSGDHDLLPSQGVALLPLLGAVPIALRVLAAEVLRKVADGSELAELWNENDDGGACWVESLSAIGVRL